MRISFTDRELDVMAVLWDRGLATATEVRERLRDETAYKTVQAVLRSLEAKGHVGRRGEGKVHRYYPIIERRVAGRSALARLIETVFNGSPELLLTQLVTDRDLSDDTLTNLRRLIDARLRTDKR